MSCRGVCAVFYICAAMQNFKKNIDVIVLILSLGMLRLFMGIPNFEPIGAMALFGGAVISSRRLALIIPLLALLFGDLLLAAWSPAYADYLKRGEFVWVYGSFIAVALIGRAILRSDRSGLNILKGAVLSSLLFFVVTNFGTWSSGLLYSRDLSGLIQCYVAGLAFYKQDLFGSFFLNSLMSTILFSALAFGLHAFFARSFKVSRQPVR